MKMPIPKLTEEGLKALAATLMRDLKTRDPLAGMENLFEQIEQEQPVLFDWLKQTVNQLPHAAIKIPDDMEIQIPSKLIDPNREFVSLQLAQNEIVITGIQVYRAIKAATEARELEESGDHKFKEAIHQTGATSSEVIIPGDLQPHHLKEALQGLPEQAERERKTQLIFPQDKVVLKRLEAEDKKTEEVGNPEPPLPLCPCGQPLHYQTPERLAQMEETIKRFGETTTVNDLGTGHQYEVSRHYIALHGLNTANLEKLAQMGHIKKLL